ncbi:MAG: inositol monophosphatase family protein [Dehalococcoidia bacterium]|nr:inositol monophosphatase family protein [Dehalococcoidia bacterium]
MTQLSQGQLPNSRSGKSAMDVAVDATRISGRILQERFRTSMQVSFKGPTDIVTDVDLAAERAVLELLRKEYPSFGILAEESPPVESDSPYTWVVDPLDGTRNYANGIPHFCTVVALARGDEPVLGVTYDPVREEMFTAQEGQGAFVNGVRLSVSEGRDLGMALLCCDLGYVDEKAGVALDMIRSLWPGLLGLRLLGSAALGVAYAAAGRVDLYFHHSLSPWDIAAGLVLVREAGGVVMDKQGRSASLRTPSVIASSSFLVDRFLQATDGHPWRDL